MFIFGHFLFSLAHVLGILLQLYMWVVLIAVIMTWFSPDPYNPFVRFFRAATDPVFRVVRKVLPFLVFGQIDLTPLAVLLMIYFLQDFLVATLMDTARRFQ